MQPFAFFNAGKISGQGFDAHLRKRAHLIGCGRQRRRIACRKHNVAAFPREGFRASKANAF